MNLSGVSNPTKNRFKLNTGLSLETLNTIFKSNQIYIFVPSLHYIQNKIFIKNIHENLKNQCGTNFF